MQNCKISLCVLFFSSISIMGCAIGQKIRYNDLPLELQATGKYIIAVSVYDNRVFIKNGEKDPSYIGTFRGAFGNPFDAYTESGKALAEDITGVICESLKKKGYKITPVIIAPKSPQDQIINRLKEARANRLLLLTLKEWRSDTYQNTTLYCDISMQIMNNMGKKMAEASEKDEDELGGSFFNPPSHAKNAVPEACTKKLESLLNSPLIINALK